MKNILYTIILSFLFSFSVFAECGYNARNDYVCDTDAEFKESYRFSAVFHCREELKRDPRIASLWNIRNVCECSANEYIKIFSVDELKEIHKMEKTFSKLDQNTRIGYHVARITIDCEEKNRK